MDSVKGSWKEESAYIVNVLTMFLQTSTLMLSCWNKSTNGKTLSCRNHKINTSGHKITSLVMHRLVIQRLHHCDITDHGEECGEVGHVQQDPVDDGEEPGVVGLKCSIRHHVLDDVLQKSVHLPSLGKQRVKVSAVHYKVLESLEKQRVKDLAANDGGWR